MGIAYLVQGNFQKKRVNEWEYTPFYGIKAGSPKILEFISYYDADTKVSVNHSSPYCVICF